MRVSDVRVFPSQKKKGCESFYLRQWLNQIVVVMFFERGVLHKVELFLKFESKKRKKKEGLVAGGEEEINKST